MPQKRPKSGQISDGNRPTQQTIADLTGLAVTTISKALRQDPKISKSTRELVEKVASEVGYVPDRAALHLRTGKTNIISLILDPHNEILSFGNSMISGIVEALQGTDYHLNITPHFTPGNIMDPVVETVRNGLADGLIFSRTRAFDERVKFLLDRHFPFVSHGRTEFTQPHSYVDYDNDEFAYQAVMRMVEKGCNKICILLPMNDFTFYQHMRYGFMRAVRETGVDYLLPQTVTLDSAPEELFEWAQQVASQSEMPDGFICPGETSYFSVISGLGERGKVQERDFQVVAKSVSSVLRMMRPAIDCISEDVHEAGFLMAKHLIANLQDGTTSPIQTLQKPSFSFTPART